MATGLTFKSHSPIVPGHSFYKETLPLFTYEIYVEGILSETVSERFMSKTHFHECVFIWNTFAEMLGNNEKGDPYYFYKAL